MTILKAGILGVLAGAILGWFVGLGYYGAVSVPNAEKIDPRDRASYLCSEGQAPVAVALLGIILGGIFGTGIGCGIVISAKRVKQ